MPFSFALFAFFLALLLLIGLLLRVGVERSIHSIQVAVFFFFCCMYVLSGVEWAGGGVCSCFLLSCLLRLLVCSLAGCESRWQELKKINWFGVFSIRVTYRDTSRTWGRSTKEAQADVGFCLTASGPEL
jgi:hypothetical protein